MTIKFCVWDVGQVIYPYTLSYLDEWALSKTKDKENYISKGGIKKFDYNPYMAGEVNNEEFCKKLCAEYNIAYLPQTPLEIKRALYKGVGNYFEETLQTMHSLSAKGIKNCILSNALPMLKDTAPQEVEPQYRFASFELKLLKPNPEIYKSVRQLLGCHFNEMIFIDDKEKNVLSAKSLGIHGIVFDKNTIHQNCLSIVDKQKSLPFNIKSNKER